jgi:hypothetical protein
MDIVNQYVGTGLLFFVKQLVDLVKPCYEGSKFAGLLNISFALAFGIILNLAFSFLSDGNIHKAIAAGILAGFGSVIYNDVKKSIDGK